jgi:hypothetical protein
MASRDDDTIKGLLQALESTMDDVDNCRPWLANFSQRSGRTSRCRRRRCGTTAKNWTNSRSSGRT